MSFCKQEAADYTFTWCKSNDMLLKATKQNSIIFNLQKQIHSEPLIIGESAVSNDDEVKLLGVAFDKNMWTV